MIALFLAAAAAATPATTIDAQSAELRAAEKKIIAVGEVVAVHGGYTLRCPRAVADFDDESGQRRIRLITATGGVAVDNGRRKARGDQAVFDDTARTIVLTGSPEVIEGTSRVQGNRIVLNVDTDAVDIRQPRAHLPATGAQPPTRLEANRAMVKDQGRTLVFDGEVVVRRGDLVVEAPRGRAKTDRNGKLTTFVLDAGVKATEGQRVATGERAVWDALTRTLTLSGSQPRLTDGADVVAGERIVFFADTDRVEVTKATAQIQGGAQR